MITSVFLQSARELLLEIKNSENKNAIQWAIAEAELESYVPSGIEVHARIRRLKAQLDECFDKHEVANYENIRELSQMIRQLLSIRKPRNDVEKYS